MRDLAIVISNKNKNITPIETINTVKEAGFENVFIQWYNKNWEISQEKQLEYIKKQNLNVVFAHLGYQYINDIWEDGDSGDKLVDSYINDLDICKKNNISMVIMHLASKFTPKPFNEKGLNRIRKIVEYAEKLNIKIAFENTKQLDYLEKVLDNIKNENVGLCYDSGHCHAFSDDKFNYDKFKNRIFAVHLHDNDKSDDLHLLPFDGTIDWENIIEKLKDCNYEGPITIETTYRNNYLKKTPIEFYKDAYDAAKKISDMFEK